MILREATAADAPGILDLRRRCFPEDEIEKHFPIARAFLAEAEGRAVAHLGFVEQTYVLGGVEHPGVLAVDAMTDPAFRGQGLFSRVAGFARDAIRSDYALSTAWQIRPAVLPAMVSNGWLPVLRAPVFVRPQLFRGVVEERQSYLSGQAGLPLLHRPRWRFEAPYYTCTENLVTRETVLEGYRTLAIVDLTPQAKGELKAAFRSSTSRLAAALLSWRHPALPLLLRMGFLPSPHRFRFLVNAFDPRIEAKGARWALSWADTDHL